MAQGKSKHCFRWKHKDGNNEYTYTVGVGHTAREVITDFINRNLAQNLEYFKKKFESLGQGKGHPRIVSLEYAQEEYKNKGHKKYFIDSKYCIKLNNDETVVISTEWGATGILKNSWEKFKDKMAEYGYSIAQCRFVNISEDSRRNWRDCEKYGFVAAGSKDMYQKDMEKLKVGSVIFAYRGGNFIPQDKKRFIAWGSVINEAVRIDEFKVADGRLLSECESVHGGNYKEKYSGSFNGELCDYAVGIEWVKVLSEEDAVKLIWNANAVRDSIKESDFEKLRKAFNLGGESDE